MPADNIVIAFNQKMDSLVFLVQIICPSIQAIEFLERCLLGRCQQICALILVKSFLLWFLRRWLFLRLWLSLGWPRIMQRLHLWILLLVMSSSLRQVMIYRARSLLLVEIWSFWFCVNMPVLVIKNWTLCLPLISLDLLFSWSRILG